MGQLTATQRLGAFVADLAYDGLPPEVRVKAKLCTGTGRVPMRGPSELGAYVNGTATGPPSMPR